MRLARFKRIVARLFIAAPWLGVVGQRVWRRLRVPRYSIGAVGVVFNAAGEILLVEHVFHPARPWGLPGGWVDRGETPGQTVARELHEETSLHVRVIMPLLFELGQYRMHVDAAYLCELESGELQLSGELLDYRWCLPDELPPLFPFQQRAIRLAVDMRARHLVEWSQ